MTTTSKSISPVVKPRYHSRLGVIVAKELGDKFQRSRRGRVIIVMALLIVPISLYLARQAAYGSSYTTDPFMENMDMRRQLPLHLSMLILAGTILWRKEAAGDREEAMMLEPLLATATKRWELVLGRLLAFAIAWLGVTAIITLSLATELRIPAIVAWCPFLSYFHSNVTFFAQFALAYLLYGCCTFAGWEFVMLLRNKRGSIEFFAAILLMLIPLIAVILGTNWASYLLGFGPLNNGAPISAAFSQLPLDPRVHFRTVELANEYHKPYLWLCLVVETAITTMTLSIMTARGLDRGDSLWNTARRKPARRVAKGE